MKISMLLLVTFVAIVMISSVEGWRRRRFRIRIRGRRILQKLCSPVCSTTCRAACSACTPVCAYGCKRLCRGKREANQDLPDGSYNKPMPCDFEAYDLNGDKIISREELGGQNGETGEEEDVKQLFTLMDLDGDSGVDPDEFEVAPLVRNCDGKDEDSSKPKLDNLLDSSKDKDALKRELDNLLEGDDLDRDDD